MWWFVQLALAAGWVVVLVLGAWTISNEMASIGTIFLLYQYVLLIGRPLEDLVHQLETVQKANGAMVRVLDLLAITPKVLDEGTSSPADGPITVRFEHVDFDYGDDQPVLRDVTLELGAGRSIGIVGRTGSGKTTFSRLVLRLVEPTSGTVLLGGVPIQDISLVELRRRVALVSQEVELFAGTIRDNVTLFDDSVDDDRVVDALRSVGLDALVDGGIHRQLGACRRRPVGRPGAAAVAGAGVDAQPRRARLRRGDGAHRPTDRAPDRSGDRPTDGRPDDARHRASPVDPPRRRRRRSCSTTAKWSSSAHRAELVGDDESRFARLLALTLDDQDGRTRSRAAAAIGR